MFKELGFQDEPMPNFDSRFPGRLESCLQQPFARFERHIFYRGVLRKAVALFYFCIKDHPFENGNKRFAVTIMMFFMVKNGLWIRTRPETLYNIAKMVATTNEDVQSVIKALTKEFKPYVEPL